MTLWSVLVLALVLPNRASALIYTTTQTLSAVVEPYVALSVPGSVSLSSGATPFSVHTGSLIISYRARTLDTGGGSIQVKADSEFSPAGGLTVGGVTYTCSGATLGTNCSGSQTLSTSTSTAVVTLPAGACTGGGGGCSSADPNTATMSFIAQNKPSYKTGNYSTTLTITITSF